MARPSLRENIIQAGLVTLHERGFYAPGVREIMAAAHAPQSSFSNYFQSKEAFGLEVLNRYFERLEAIPDDAVRSTPRAARSAARLFRRDHGAGGGCWMAARLSHQQHELGDGGA